MYEVKISKFSKKHSLDYYEWEMEKVGKESATKIKEMFKKWRGLVNGHG